MPSLTCVPCTTEPGGDWVRLTPIRIGSAASAGSANNVAMDSAANGRK